MRLRRGVAQIFAAMVGQRVDSDQLVSANPLANRSDEKRAPDGPGL